MTDLAALIERLERATEGSRELDLEIGELVGQADHSGPAWHRPFKDWAKPYTTSLDAALTLVPEDCALDHLCDHWRVENGVAIKTGGVTCKIVKARPITKTLPRKIQVEAVTRALAVTLAALRARQP